MPQLIPSLWLQLAELHKDDQEEEEERARMDASQTRAELKNSARNDSALDTSCHDSRRSFKRSLTALERRELLSFSSGSLKRPSDKDLSMKRPIDPPLVDEIRTNTAAGRLKTESPRTDSMRSTEMQPARKADLTSTLEKLDILMTQESKSA
jgi:hypothetical protein